MEPERASPPTAGPSLSATPRPPVTPPPVPAATGFPQAANGRWSVNDCATTWYDWAVTGNLIRFSDQDKKAYEERITASPPDRFTTVPLAADGQPRTDEVWTYTFLSTALVRIERYVDGKLIKGFDQHRCNAAGGATAAGPVALTSLTARPPPAASSSLEQATRSFVNNYFAHASGNATDVLSYAAQDYADEVRYYGKLTPRNTIIKEKASYLKRWPVCTYATRPAASLVSCDAAGSLCTFSGLVDWDCSDPGRAGGPAHSSGTSTVTLGIIPGRPPYRMTIMEETSAVVARNQAAK